MCHPKPGPKQAGAPGVHITAAFRQQNQIVLTDQSAQGKKVNGWIVLNFQVFIFFYISSELFAADRRYRDSYVIAQDISEVNQAAGEMSSSSAQVQISAEELSKVSEQIQAMVAKFKV